MFIWTNINVGKVRVLGLDATANVMHKFSDKHLITLTASYSLQNAETVLIRNLHIMDTRLPIHHYTLEAFLFVTKIHG